MVNVTVRSASTNGALVEFSDGRLLFTQATLFANADRDQPIDPAEDFNVSYEAMAQNPTALPNTFLLESPSGQNFEIIDTNTNWIMFQTDDGRVTAVDITQADDFADGNNGVFDIDAALSAISTPVNTPPFSSAFQFFDSSGDAFTIERIGDSTLLVEREDGTHYTLPVGSNGNLDTLDDPNSDRQIDVDAIASTNSTNNNFITREYFSANGDAFSITGVNNTWSALVRESDGKTVLINTETGGFSLDINTQSTFSQDYRIDVDEIFNDVAGANAPLAGVAFELVDGQNRDFTVERSNQTDFLVRYDDGSVELFDNALFTSPAFHSGTNVIDLSTVFDDQPNSVTTNAIAYRFISSSGRNFDIQFHDGAFYSVTDQDTGESWVIRLDGVSAGTQDQSGTDGTFSAPLDGIIDIDGIIANIGPRTGSGGGGDEAWQISETIGGTTTICFTASTQILTAEGQRPVGELKIGDMVETQDRGLQPIRWIGVTKFDCIDIAHQPKLRPIRIKAGALGHNVPGADLVVSRQHRILLRSQIAERMFGEKEVLIPAVKLLELSGVIEDETTENVDYYHIMFDQHEIIWANGTPAESLLTGPIALNAVGDEAREELQRIMPELFNETHDYEPARMVPSGKMQKRLVGRHLKNEKPLYTL